MKGGKWATRRNAKRVRRFMRGLQRRKQRLRDKGKEYLTWDVAVLMREEQTK